ncbi:MAG: hypothetical protein LBH06_00780 [Rikenellaceae bacterium]|nr:hypothetical protein [Rikenellaceae bacterium]
MMKTTTRIPAKAYFNDRTGIVTLSSPFSRLYEVFERVSDMLNFCRDNNVEITSTETI